MADAAAAALTRSNKYATWIRVPRGMNGRIHVVACKDFASPSVLHIFVRCPAALGIWPFFVLCFDFSKKISTIKSNRQASEKHVLCLCEIESMHMHFGTTTMTLPCTLGMLTISRSRQFETFESTKIIPLATSLRF